jgi:hypothetical protein
MRLLSENTGLKDWKLHDSASKQFTSRIQMTWQCKGTYLPEGARNSTTGLSALYRRLEAAAGTARRETFRARYKDASLHCGTYSYAEAACTQP